MAFYFKSILNVPKAVQFATIGFILAHEFAHAFDGAGNFQ